jgi:carbon storage regulator
MEARRGRNHVVPIRSAMIARRQFNMLVLTRKESESIRIGDDVTITVVRIDGNKVRIGVEAPKSVTIKRAELEPEDVQPTDRRRVPVHG